MKVKIGASSVVKNSGSCGDEPFQDDVVYKEDGSQARIRMIAKLDSSGKIISSWCLSCSGEIIKTSTGGHSYLCDYCSGVKYFNSLMQEIRTAESELGWIEDNFDRMVDSRGVAPSKDIQKGVIIGLNKALRLIYESRKQGIRETSEPDTK